MTEENRSPLENTEGLFTGKEFKGEGTSDKGNAWKRYKALFKPNMESEKQFSFTCFAPLKAKNTKQLDDLKEGEKYRICFSSADRTTPNGEPYTSKTVIGFYSPDGNGQKPMPQASEKVDLSDFEDFKAIYVGKVRVNKMTPSVVHMVGSFIVTVERERVKELIAKCEEALN